MSHDGATRRGSDVVMGMAGVAAIAYIGARAALVPLTYDEAIAHARYVTGPATSLLDFATATNHLLASALARASIAVAGDTPLGLRLPSVVAAAVALMAVWHLVRLVRRPAIGVAGFVAASGNPYLLQYFAVSRGYGLSVALVLVSVWSLVRAITANRDDPGTPRRLTIGGLAAVLAFAANFAALPAVLAWGGAVAVHAAVSARDHPPSDPAAPVPWRTLALLAALALAVAFGVYSQSRLLPRTDFVETTVRVSGLYPHERSSIRLYRADATGRLREVPQREAGVWRLGRVRDPWDTLRMTVPRASERQISSLEVTSGPAVWRRTPGDEGPWHVHDVGSVDRVLLSQSPLGWRSDARHVRRAIEHTVATAAAFVVAALAAIMLTRVAIRRTWIPASTAWLLVRVGLGLLAIGAAPLYLLQRDGELFFGGTTGVIADSLGSLYAATLDRREPSSAGGLGVAVVLVVAWTAVLGWRGARHTPSGRACVVLGGMLAAMSGTAVLLHAAVATPFPLGRTALVWLPMIVLLLMYAADALTSSLSTRGRAPAIVAGLVAVISGWHAVRAANLRATLDWPADSSTPEILAQIAAEWPSTSRTPLRLAVDWDLYPVVRYHAARTWPDIPHDIVVLPGDDLPVDYVYARPDTAGGPLADRTAPPPSTMPVLRRTGDR